MVYYRKYRPQKISELDLSDVREKLTSILSSKDIPHAFLFTGPRGLGKTSSARILAKAINCTNRVEGEREKGKKEGLHPSDFTLNASIEPCNKCDTCISITEGSHIDIIEIDAASNRGVDEIRSLREKVKFSPSELLKKVYIIDEVHMLTNEAFNALLKTLEEPPSHVIFVLATTEAHKIPQTIMSRVFSIKFEKPTLQEMANSLKRIAEGEKLQIDNEVFEKIANLSEGSFRDGAKIMEELSLAANGKKIDLTLLEKIYKTGSLNNLTEKLLENIYKKDLKSSLDVINSIASEGVDFKVVIEGLVEKLRGDLVSGKNLNPYDAKKILSLLNEAYQSVKISVIPQLPIELAVVEWCSGEESRITNQELRKDENEPEIKIHETKKEAVVDKLEPKVLKTDNFLKDLIDAVHKESRQVAAFLRSCKEAKVEGSVLILTTPYSLHAEKLSKQEYKELILKCVFDINEKIREVKVVVS